MLSITNLYLSKFVFLRSEVAYLQLLMPRFIPAHATTANATTAAVIIPNVIIIFFLSQFLTNTLLDFIKPRLFGDFASSSRLSNPSQKLSFLLSFILLSSFRVQR